MVLAVSEGELANIYETELTEIALDNSEFSKFGTMEIWFVN